MNKMRGQAAMEYLMTYGWALLILLVVIGVLFSMGVFNPQNYMSEECSFQPSLQCKGVSLTPNGVLTIYLVNGLGYDVDEWEMEVDGKTATYSTQDGMKKFTIQLDTTQQYKPYDIQKFKPILTYTVDGNKYTITGTTTVRTSE